MPEDEVLDILDLMLESIKLVQERFSRVGIPDDFVSTSEGVTLLDAISMRLQVIGESVKQIQKVNPVFLEKCSEIEWDKIARFRDLVSHHYEHVDHGVVFDICKRHMPKLGEVIQNLCKAHLGSESGESQ
jgi:uncharacterized protein with HEPN domain